MNIDQELREAYGDPPGDDPVKRAGHLLRVYMQLMNPLTLTSDDEILQTATTNGYKDAPWTGMTWGDLKALHALGRAGVTGARDAARDRGGTRRSQGSRLHGRDRGRGRRQDSDDRQDQVPPGSAIQAAPDRCRSTYAVVLASLVMG